MKKEVYHKLLSDLVLLKLPVNEVDIFFRPYSKTLYGRYFPIRGNNVENFKPRLYIYPFSNRKGDFLSYSVILETAIHEMVHHIQYVNPSFIRKKGIMHDTNFWKLYNHYMDKAFKFNLICKEELQNEENLG